MSENSRKRVFELESDIWKVVFPTIYFPMNFFFLQVTVINMYFLSEPEVRMLIYKVFFFIWKMCAVQCSYFSWNVFISQFLLFSPFLFVSSRSLPYLPSWTHGNSTGVGRYLLSHDFTLLLLMPISSRSLPNPLIYSSDFHSSIV